MGVQQQCSPRVRFGCQPAGQRLAARHGDVAGDHLALAGQRSEHPGVPGQQHRAERASTSASRRNAATRSSGIVASCSTTPGTGLRVHRGIVVKPPAKSTPRQNSRPASASIFIESSLHSPLPRCYLPLTRAAPKLSLLFRQTCHRASPWLGSPPTVRALGLPRLS